MAASSKIKDLENELELYFDALDIEKKGTLAFSVFKMLIENLGYQIENIEDFKNLYDLFSNKDGNINLDKVYEMMKHKNFPVRNNHSSFEQLFNAFDLNKRNMFGLKELENIVTDLNLDIPIDDLKAMIEEIDSNNDQMITKPDFMNLLERLRNEQ